MRKLAIASMLVFLLSPVASLSQGIILGTSHRNSPLSAPAFATYTFVPTTNSSLIASITSPALTLTAGDFVFVICRNSNTSPNPITVTSSPANTWTQLTARGASSGVATTQASYAFNVGAGSTTFTCTPNVSAAFQSMIVLEYHPGFITAIDVETTGQVASPGTGSTVTSSVFSTASRGLIIWCGTQNSSAVTWTVGSIGADTGTLRGFSSGSNPSTEACEYTNPTGSQSSIQATMTISAARSWVGVLAAFK